MKKLILTKHIGQIISKGDKIVNEFEKSQAGYLYDANYDSDLIKLRAKCAELCFDYNSCRPSDTKNKAALLKELLGSMGKNTCVIAPFYADYGFNITVGDNFFANYNCTVLDAARVSFGNNVFIAPGCVFSTAGHPIDKEQRAQGLEIALPISVGDDVWIGANVTVLPGVTIGSGSVIGAGSVVNRDIPSGTVAAGNPCRVIRKITADDKNKYPIFK